MEHRERLQRLLAAVDDKKKALAQYAKMLCFEVDGDQVADYAPVGELPQLKLPPGAAVLRVKDNKGYVRACVDLGVQTKGDAIFDSKRLCLSFSEDTLGFMVIKPKYAVQ